MNHAARALTLPPEIGFRDRFFLRPPCSHGLTLDFCLGLRAAPLARFCLGSELFGYSPSMTTRLIFCPVKRSILLSFSQSPGPTKEIA